MPKTTDSVIFSDAEQEILEIALQNPDMSNSEIADETGYRLTLIRDTRREYEDDVELAEDVAEAAEAAAEASTADIDDDLSEAEQVILDLVAENPQITNAEIAKKTGARVALVRDTRDAYGDQIDTQPVDDEADEADSEPSGPGEPSAAQQEILEVAADDPTLSNADIAEQTAARITLVRDTLDQYDGPSDTGGDEPADADTESGSAIQDEIREAAAANPAATNRELAEQTGARITLVRDTLAEPTRSETAADDGDSESDDSNVLEDVDTEAFSGTQLRILETHLSNPELTNAEIAEQTDTRVALVRDTIYDHEYDDKPWVGNVEVSEKDQAEDDDEIIVESDDEVEIPDTTASDLFNDRQRAVLEAALENPELTNSEIAEETGARLTLVRDTRATYEDGVELADSDDDEATTPTSSPATVTFSEKQEEIIAAADADGEASISEIADQTGSRIPLVRDTLAAAETGDVGGGGDDAAEDDTGADDDAPGADPSTADSAAADSTTEDGGISDTVLVAIVVAIILLFGIAVMLL